MRVSFGKILGASALLAVGTACGGTAATDHGSGGGGGMANAAGSGVTAGMDAAAGVAGQAQGTAGVGGSEGGAAGTVDIVGEAGADTGGAGGAGGTGGLGGFAGGPPVDIGPQQQATKLDVLFVVDNSVSMADKQGVLEASLPSFVSRLVNPHCVDAQGVPIATQPANGAAACASGTRELTPVTDLHLGVITTSIGSHGGTVCSTGSATDRGTEASAALWKIMSTPAHARAHAAGSVRSPSINSIASRPIRLDRLPVMKLSMPRTVSPRATSAAAIERPPAAYRRSNHFGQDRQGGVRGDVVREQVCGCHHRSQGP